MLDFEVKSAVLSIQLPAGPSFYMTDFSAASGSPDAINAPLPDSLPQNLFIIGTDGRREQNADGQIVAFIDKERAAYNSGMPPDHQVGPFFPIGRGGGLFDYRSISVINSLASFQQEENREFSYPRVLNRATDSIWIQNDGQAGTLYSLVLHYLVPATSQPDATPWVPNPPPPGATIAWWLPLDSSTSGNTPLAIRDIATLTAGGTQIRFHFQALAQSCAASHVSFGKRNSGSTTLASPTEITFGGGSGFSLTANGGIWSDWMPIGTVSGDQLLVEIDLTTGAWAYRAAGTDGNYSSPTPSWNATAMASPMFQANRSHVLDRVEVR